MECKVPLVARVLKVVRVRQDSKVLQEVLALPDLLAFLVIGVQRDPQDPLDF